MNLREQILGIADIAKEKVRVPEWDVELEVRGLTASARARVLQRSLNADGGLDLERLYPELVIASCFDPISGEQVFREKEDRFVVGHKSAAAVERIAAVAMRLSGMRGDDVARATKNSDSTPS